MATYLYALGRFAFRRRRLVALLWVALLALAAVAAGSASTPKPSSFTIPGAEAQHAVDLLDERFPGSNSGGATARVVFQMPDGQKITAAEGKAEVRQAVRELEASSPQVASVTDPFKADAVSANGTTAYAQVTYKVDAAALDDSAKDALKEAVEQARATGLHVEAGGEAVQETHAGGATEVIGVAVAAVVLVLTFGALVAAGLPLLTAIVGVGIGALAVQALANPLGLGDSTGSLAMMIGLAVGIDYALFIVSRYRAELAEGRDREHAAGLAVGTAGSAVVFAGLTVVIALGGLAVVGVPMLTKMGLAAAGTVVVAVLVALTLIPALLGFAGAKVLPRKVRKAAKEGRPHPRHEGRVPAGVRWANLVLRRPVAVLAAGVLGLVALALPVASLQLGLPDDGSQPTSTTQRRAYDLLSDGFGPGFNGPLVLAVDARGSDSPEAAADRVAAAVRKTDGVTSVAAARFNEAGDTASITVVPASKPSSAATERLVEDIRDRAPALERATGAEVLVGGQTAMNVDFSLKMSDALVPYLALVVGLAFVLLTVVFRSLLVPLKAALGFLLSVLAALGAVVAVFQWGWLAGLFGVEVTGPIMSLMPIFMVGVVFGLAMDYEVFLVTRMREAHVHGEAPRQAIVTGFRHGARVVSAAAVIMIAVFAGFIGTDEAMIKMIGFGLATAVLFDAFVVRMAIVPAVLALLGERAWSLPRWLDRILPDVDVEGEKLNRHPGPEPDRPADREPSLTPG